MSTFYTKGIILTQTDRGEADQLFRIYTLSNGKVSALGRATKKIQSKLNPSLQQFAILELMIATGKSHDHVAAVKIEKNFANIKNDLKKIVLGSYALELVEKLTKIDSPDPKMFTLLVKYFTALEENSFEDSEWQVVKQAFAVKLLTILGLEPKEEVIADAKKFDNFLVNQLDAQLNTEQFMLKISSLTPLDM